MLDYWQLNNLVRPAPAPVPRRDYVRPWLNRPSNIVRPVPPLVLAAATAAATVHAAAAPPWAPDTDDEEFARRVEREIRERRLRPPSPPRSVDEEDEMFNPFEPPSDDDVDEELLEDYEEYLRQGPPPGGVFHPDTEDEEAAERIPRELQELREQAALEEHETDCADELAHQMAALGSPLPFRPEGALRPVTSSPDQSSYSQRRRFVLAAAERRLLLTRPLDDSAVDVASDAEYGGDNCPCPCHFNRRRRRLPFVPEEESGYETPSPNRSTVSTVPCDSDGGPRSGSFSEHDDSAYGGAYARNYADAPWSDGEGIFLSLLFSFFH